MRAMLRYRYLFTQMVQRELRQKYKGSALGVLWYVVNPLVLMAAYWLMFGTLIPVVNEPDYPLFLMVGLIVWLFFAQSLTGAADSLIAQSSLVSKVRSTGYGVRRWMKWSWMACARAINRQRLRQGPT